MPFPGGSGPFLRLLPDLSWGGADTGVRDVEGLNRHGLSAVLSGDRHLISYFRPDNSIRRLARFSV